MKWNVICNAEVRFSCVRSFLQSKSCQSFNATEITNLELLETLLLCLVQQSKLRECKAMDAEKLLSQWEKVVKCNFMNKAQLY